MSIATSREASRPTSTALAALASPQRAAISTAADASVASARATAKAIGKVLHRPSVLPVPRKALELVLGELAGVVATGQRVLPKKALALGYRFRFPELEPALRDLLGR